MSEFCAFLTAIREAAELTQSDVARRMGVDRNRVWAWETAYRKIQVDDLARYLKAVDATQAQRLRALALAASDGGHVDTNVEAPDAPIEVPVLEDELVDEGPPDVGECWRGASCGGRLVPVLDGPVWVASTCPDCELTRDNDPARPASDVLVVTEQVRAAKGRAA